MSKVWKLCWIIFSIASLVMPLTAKPCFITNCPPGGKRSDRFVGATAIFKEQEQTTCAKCGPSEDGTCFGSSICCGSRFGCFFNSKETSICLLNNLTSSQACDEQFWRIRLKARACSVSATNADGVCVSDGLCCSLNQCKRNSSCQHVSSTRFGPRTVDDLEPFTHHKYLGLHD